MHHLLRVALSCAILGVGLLGAPDVLWETRLGGDSDEHGKCVIESAGGGFAIAGTTHSEGEGDACLLKLDAHGALLWQKRYGGASHDDARCVVQTRDGGFALCGKSESFRQPGAFDEYADVYVVRTDADGELLWERTYGSLDYDWGSAIVEDADGALVIAGVSGPEGLLMKIDAAGQLLWERRFGPVVTVAWSLDRTPDGGYVIGGIQDVQGRGLDLLLLRADSNGSVLWQKTFGGPYRDESGFARCASGGGFILTGTVIAEGTTHSDLCLIRTDDAGNLLWQATCGGPYQDYGFAVTETPDGGFVACGLRDSASPNVQAFLVKADAAGTIVETLDFGSAGYEGFYSVAATCGGGIVAVGDLQTDDAALDIYAVHLAPADRGPALKRGDANIDGSLDIADPVRVLGHLFEGRAVRCRDACDANDDGRLDLSDPITLLLHLFRAARPLPVPTGTCGADETADGLGCENFDFCISGDSH